MSRGRNRAPVLKGEHTSLLLFLPVSTLDTCVLLVLVGIYRVPRLAHACTVHLCITYKRFPLACKSINKHVPGCTHAERVFLLAGTVRVSIKFKSNCTVYPHGSDFKKPGVAAWFKRGTDFIYNAKEEYMSRVSMRGCYIAVHAYMLPFKGNVTHAGCE